MGIVTAFFIILAIIMAYFYFFKKNSGNLTEDVTYCSGPPRYSSIERQVGVLEITSHKILFKSLVNNLVFFEISPSSIVDVTFLQQSNFTKSWFLDAGETQGSNIYPKTIDFYIKYFDDYGKKVDLKFLFSGTALRAKYIRKTILKIKGSA